jgi:hypothetical protein
MAFWATDSLDAGRPSRRRSGATQHEYWLKNSVFSYAATFELCIFFLMSLIILLVTVTGLRRRCRSGCPGQLDWAVAACSASGANAGPATSPGPGALDARDSGGLVNLRLSASKSRNVTITAIIQVKSHRLRV